MQYSATTWNMIDGWRDHGEPVASPALVLCFAGATALEVIEPYAVLQGKFPLANIVGCTTGGEIFQDQVSDAGLVALAIRFDATPVRVVARTLEYPQDSDRRLLMAQRSVDEVKAVVKALNRLTSGDQFLPIGFYSYGEIAPNDFTAQCELHNQTMTVTTLAEAT